MAIGKNEVRLRVVGVFYDEKFLYDQLVTTSGKAKPTIKDLLDHAVKDGAMVEIPWGAEKQKINRFGYTAATKFKPAGTTYPATEGVISSLLGFEHALEEKIEPSLGKRTRAAGYYKLFESTSVEKDSVTVHAWQYYLIRGEDIESNYWLGDSINPDVSPADPKKTGGDGGKGAGFTPFDTVALEPGDEVVWRNVSIVRNPQTPPIY